MTDKTKKETWRVPIGKVAGMLRRGQIKEVEDLVRKGDIPKFPPRLGEKYGINKSLWANA